MTCFIKNKSVFQGGMKAVVWTDVFQGLILLGGLIAVMVVVSIHVIKRF